MVTLPMSSIDGIVRCEVTTAVDAYIVFGGTLTAPKTSITSWLGMVPTSNFFYIVVCPGLLGQNLIPYVDNACIDQILLHVAWGDELVLSPSEPT